MSKIKIKKTKREKRETIKKKNILTLNNYIDENKSKSMEELYDLYETTSIKPNKLMDDNMLLLAIKHIIDSRRSNETFDVVDASEDFQGYPSIYDKNFNEKIFKKKEFNINKIDAINYSQSIKELTDKLCTFNLSNNQKFLKTFISTNTPYNGLLLFHGTGVGKTCSSISIAENFKKVITETNKKIIVLLNPSIKQNFIKNIFNIEKYKNGEENNQCTKDSYLKEANIDTSKKRDELKQEDLDLINTKIMKIINNRYSFYGYGAFTNVIENIYNEISQRYDDESVINSIFEKKIKQIFANNVMIVDEVHNIKETTDTKMLPKILKQVLEIADNLKLLLLSATPMFDKPDEIIDILNLLLINDNRVIIEKKQVFNNNKITAEGRDILLNKSRGYVSYLRGEHPIKFPQRLYPDIFDNPEIEEYKEHKQSIIKEYPKLDVKGRNIKDENRIKLLKIIGCPMDKYQLDKYNSMNINSTDENMGAFNIGGLTASNIVYPSDDAEVSINQITGETGFKQIFKREPNKKFSFLDDKYENMFSKSEIKKYSSKISTIINNIDKSEGIVFIYSQFIYAGTLPLAMALESNGYSKFDGSLLSTKPQEQYKKDKKFIIISGDNEVSKDAYSKYLRLEKENMNGEKVKVIIGSQTAAEGLDFKYIREVHILDPWYHFNKIEQVVGRGIRNCSHIDLDEAKRNVLVYMYASTLSDNPSNDLETIDLNLYRISEGKMKQISEIEYLLKTNAVDCNLNKEGNRFIDEFYNKDIIITTSKNTSHTIKYKDIDNSKICNFKECDFKCKPDLTDKKIVINENTFDYDRVKDNIYEIKESIKNMYKNIDQKNLVYLLDNILNNIKAKYSGEHDDLIFYALSQIIKKKEIFSNYQGKLGTIKKQGKYYIFVPQFLGNQLVSYNNIRIPSEKKKYSTKKKVKVISPAVEEANVFKLAKKILKALDLERTAKIKLLKDKKYEDDRKTLIVLVNKYYEKFFLERILVNDKKLLLEYIIYKTRNNTNPSTLNKKGVLTLGEKLLLLLREGLNKNLLYLKRDVDVISDQKDYIWGYKLAIDDNIKYFKYDLDTKTFIDPSSDEIKSLKKNLNIKLRQEDSSSEIIGYLEYKKTTNSINLKIRDKKEEGVKGTQKRTGSICGNDGMKKNVIEEFIEEVEGKKYSDREKTKIPGKPNLCFELELYLRNNDLTNKDQKRWFYNMEESIERELNKKIY